MDTPNVQAFKAKIETKASQTFEKSNGGSYVLHNVLVLEGPLQGKLVTGTRTIKNAEGKENDHVEVDQECAVYPRQSDTGKWFFEISTLVPVTSDEEISSLMSGFVGNNAQEALDSQRVN